MFHLYFEFCTSPSCIFEFLETSFKLLNSVLAELFIIIELIKHIFTILRRADCEIKHNKTHLLFEFVLL